MFDWNAALVVAGVIIALALNTCAAATVSHRIRGDGLAYIVLIIWAAGVPTVVFAGFLHGGAFQ